jgi:serine/threonine-protein kinase haspin
VCAFSTWAERVTAAFRIIKVGEGSYGEVFKLDTSLEAPNISRRKPAAHGECIFKLIPLRAKGSQSNGQTSLDALVREIQMLKLMDPVPGFARFRDLTVLQGQYPSSFAEAFHDYESNEENDSRSLEPSQYPGKQLWVMIEMDDAGRDLETLKSPSAYEVFDIFWLTCCALSYAEDYTEFEVCFLPARSP